jgi:hypothetical protein
MSLDHSGSTYDEAQLRGCAEKEVYQLSDDEPGSMCSAPFAHYVERIIFITSRSHL